MYFGNFPFLLNYVANETEHTKLLYADLEPPHSLENASWIISSTHQNQMHALLFYDEWSSGVRNKWLITFSNTSRVQILWVSSILSINTSLK